MFLFFDICNYICLDDHIIFWLYLYFLNNLYFFKYSCTNVFHSHSLYTFYNKILFCKFVCTRPWGQGMDMSAHSWQNCVLKMCISKGISYIRQMQRTYTKVLHEIYSNVTRVFQIFTSYKSVTFGYPKVHRPTYLIVISTDDLAPNRPQIWVWYGILTWINQFTAIDLNMLARIWRQQCILLSLLSLCSFSQRWHVCVHLSQIQFCFVHNPSE